jgi:RND family efflux transporter MFP subunit
MNKRISFFVIFFVTLGIVCGIGLLGQNMRKGDPAAAQDTQSADQPQAVAVQVEPVAFRKVQRSIESVGTLCAYETVTVASKLDGQVKKIHHDMSDRVKANDPLLEIDSVDFDLALEHSNKSLFADLSRLGLSSSDLNPDTTNPLTIIERFPTVLQARARMENSASRLRRMESLAKENAAAQEQVENAKAEATVAGAEYNNQMLMAASALVVLQDRQLAIAQAQQKLKDTVVRAPVPSRPIPGVDGEMTYAITARLVAEGSYVRAGTEVFRLVIDRPLKLMASVPERYAGEVKQGQKASITTVASSEVITGTVSRINPAIDAATRTIEVEILVPNSEGKVKPGSFAKAAILTQENPKVATVPLEALVNFAGANKIFLVEKDRAKDVRVTLGQQTANWVEITSPELPEGTLVVLSSQALLVDGTPLTPRATSGVAARGPEKK